MLNVILVIMVAFNVIVYHINVCIIVLVNCIFQVILYVAYECLHFESYVTYVCTNHNFDCVVFVRIVLFSICNVY